MNTLALLGSTMGLSFTSGINLYATVLTAGLAIRNGWVTGYPEGLQSLGSMPVLVVAGVLYSCEFLADKIPAFDNLWDAVHTFIRPVAGAGLAFAAAGTADPKFAVVAGLLGGGVAATTHVTKSCTRLVVNTSPEPFSNIVLSFLEDIGAVSLAYMALAHPYVALAIVVTLLIAIYYFGPIILRLIMFLFSAIAAQILSWFTAQRTSDYLPGDHLAIIGTERKTSLSVRCFARRCGKAGSNRKGMLTITGDELLFTYRKLFRIWMEPVPRDTTTHARIREGFLYNTLEINQQNGKVVSFLFTKNRTELAQKVRQVIGEKQADPAPEKPKATEEMPTPASA